MRRETAPFLRTRSICGPWTGSPTGYWGVAPTVEETLWTASYQLAEGDWYWCSQSTVGSTQSGERPVTARSGNVSSTRQHSIMGHGTEEEEELRTVTTVTCTFKALFSPVHTLHSLLPPVKSNPYGLRSRDHNFQLPVCNSFSRKSFIIRSLFRFK